MQNKATALPECPKRRRGGQPFSVPLDMAKVLMQLGEELSE
jgi:hypothetical protein